MFETATLQTGTTAQRLWSACAGMGSAALVASGLVLAVPGMAPPPVLAAGWAVPLAPPPGADATWHGPISSPPNKCRFGTCVHRLGSGRFGFPGCDPGQAIRVRQLLEPAYRVDPVYPPLAVLARIAGRVQFIASVAADGHVCEVKVVRGHPLLIPAAMEAVRQWVYAPTLLNGQPVEMQTPIEVNFILSR